MKNKIVLLLLVFCLVCSCSLTAYAQGAPDLDRRGSIEVNVSYNGTALKDLQLTCIKVGYVASDGDENYAFYRYYDGKRLDDIQDKDLPEDLLQFVNDNSGSCKFSTLSVRVDKEGIAKFENCLPGLYLIVQEEAYSGYSKIKPFLVSVPYTVDGEYRYNVDATIKSELKKEPKPETPGGSTPPTDEKLPQTGQLNWPVPVMASIGALLFMAGWILCYGRKKEEK